MTLPALPGPNSTNWYAHYAALDAKARNAATHGEAQQLVTAALPNLTSTIRSYNDASPTTVRIVDIGSSVGLGPGGALSTTNSVGAYLNASLGPYLNPLGNIAVTYTNGCESGGTFATGYTTQYAAVKTLAGGAPSLLCIVYGMNDGMSDQYHAGQTYPGVDSIGRRLINKAQSDGADVILFTTPHPHSGRTPWTTGQGIVYPASGNMIPADTTASSIRTITNINGAQVPASYRHLRVNQSIRELAADTGSLLLDAELYWFTAVETYGEDALFGAGDFNHPNLFGFQQSFFKAIDDLMDGLRQSTVRGGIVSGQRTSVPMQSTGESHLSISNGGTYAMTLPKNSVGTLLIHGSSGGGWHSVWTGDFVTTASASAVTGTGNTFISPGQLITGVTGSSTDTTATIATTATGSGGEVSWSATYFTLVAS